MKEKVRTVVLIILLTCFIVYALYASHLATSNLGN